VLGDNDLLSTRHLRKALIVSSNCKMKILLTILLTIFLFQGFSQTYETKKIILKADSTLLSTAGNSLYQYFKYDSTTYYEYGIKNNKLKWETLNKKALTKGDFKKSYVRFKFNHPKYPWVNNSCSVRFDSLLNLSEPFDLDFIPAFLKEGKENNFISAEQAMHIAKSCIKEDRKKIEARLIYNLFNIKGYSWLVSNYFDQKQVELVIINPITEAVLQHYNSYYGPLH